MFEENIPSFSISINPICDPVCVYFFAESISQFPTMEFPTMVIYSKMDAFSKSSMYSG